MLKVMRWLGWFGVLIALLPQASPVSACGGGIGGPDLKELIDTASLVVKARVLDVDQYGQTGVVEVIDYFYGTSASNKLLVVQLDPISTSFFTEQRRGSGDCATMADPLYLDEEVYLFLKRGNNGSYNPVVRPDSLLAVPPVFRFPTPSTLVETYVRDSDENIHRITLNEGEFRAFLMAQLSQAAVHSIAIDDQYPLPAPILLTTESGLNYLFPVDHSQPILISSWEAPTLRRTLSFWRRGDPLGVSGCHTSGCVAYGPDGSARATLLSSSVILTDELRLRDYRIGIQPQRQILNGMGFLFSPTDEFMALWTAEGLDFYGFYYPRLAAHSHHWIVFQYPTQQAQSWSGLGAWSPDGRLFAFTDLDGLWLLDVYSQTARLLIAADPDRPQAIARYFSPGGRYLAVTQGEQRANLDLLTMTLHPDGVISHDERSLLAYDTAVPISEHRLCRLTAPDDRCYELGLGRGATWINDQRYLWAKCESHEAIACDFIVDQHICCNNIWLGQGLTADYERITDSYLVLRDEQTLAVVSSYRTGSEHSLSRWFDEPIIAAEWLPALYSGERTFSPIVIARYQAWLAAQPSF